jgi:crossover junction endodeoxyribonuclease RusA
MTEARITVVGEPVAKERPRMGKHGNVYTPAATRAFETAVSLIARAQLPKFKERDRVVIDLTFYCTSDAKDLDNLCKSTLDGLQKAGTFKNDKQIMELHARKHVRLDGETARTEISVGLLG